MAFEPEELLGKIHAKGYWRVVMTPSLFEERRIATLQECWEIVHSAEVSLRGWNYPFAHEPDRIMGQDWVACGADFRGNIEYWQFFQSGQFVHHFACREDHEPLPYRSSEPCEGPFLDFAWALYTCTEIFEFAARLASKEILAPAANVSVKLVGTKDRLLTSTNLARRLSVPYFCRIPEIEFTASANSVDLIARSGELALDCVMHFYERFGWTTASRQMLAEDQRRLIERRL